MRNDRITLYPVGREARYPDLSCTGEGKAQHRRDPSVGAGRLCPRFSTVTRRSWLRSAVMARAAVHKVGRSTAPAGTTPVVR